MVTSMQPRPKIRRKPAPALDAALLDARYPPPDPNDPFAPLWVLRSRNSTNSLKKLYDLYPTRAQSPTPPVAFPVIHDHVSTTSESSTTTDTDHHHPKWHNRLLRRVHVPPAPIPPSSSASTTSSFVHVSTPCCSDPFVPTDAPEWAIPTPTQLTHAASLPVIAPSGLRVPFASLFAARPTIVVFIRHFWCPNCQDYVSSIAQTAPPPSEKSPVDLVLIGNGAPAFIPKYRALFGLEFEIYTDPTLAVYTALGMGCSSASDTTTTNGDYARHGTMGGIATVVLRALKAGLPVWERGGDIHQLGGEFILGPGLTCTYAHRMQSPKGHAPIRAVLSAAGVDIPPSHSSVPATISSSPSAPKLLTALRMKGWSPQKRSSSLGIISPSPSPSKTTTPPSTKSKSKSKANRRNMSLSTETYPSPIPIMGSPTRPKTRADSSSPGPGQISEFGAWRRSGRVSFDSSRALSEGARRNCQSYIYQSNSLPYASPSPSPGPGLGHTSTSPYQRHRQYASTATLPMYSSSLFSSFGVREQEREPDKEEEETVCPIPEFLAPEDKDEWMRARMVSLEAMKERKRERRAGFVGYYVPLAGGGGGGGGGSGNGSPDRRKRSGSTSTSVPVSVSVGRPASSGMGCEPVKEAEEEAEGDAYVGGKVIEYDAQDERQCQRQ